MSLVTELTAVLADAPVDLARAALVVAKLESPALDPSPCLAALDELGARARARLAHVADASVRARIAALNGLLFEDERFSGNRDHYDDVRNSFLNVVVERRLGIPITLALVYMEVARRAGLEVQGVAFPGHFLMRVPKVETPAAGTDDAVILDPFGGGVELNRADCRRLLGRHMGPLSERTSLNPRLLAPCTTRQMLARMLNNLKRSYIDSRSFPQARSVADLLIAVDPSQTSELRDRGLLAYHLDDFPAALRDLEQYLRVNAWRESDREERDQIREHVQTLRNRVASLN